MYHLYSCVQSFCAISSLVLTAVDQSIESGMDVLNGAGDTVNILRFLGWFVTCPVQVAALCNLNHIADYASAEGSTHQGDAGTVNEATMMAIMTNMLVCATMMATAASPTFKVIYFLVGGVLCAYLFYVFGSVFRKYQRLVPESKSAKVLLPVFYLAWSMFPITALLSPYGFSTVSESTAGAMLYVVRAGSSSNNNVKQ
jgi:bacteriorhodopsin